VKWRIRRPQPTLPLALAALAEYQSHELRAQMFYEDATKLITKIEAARKRRDEALTAAQQAAEEAEGQKGERYVIARVNALALSGEFQEARNAVAGLALRASKIAALDKILEIAEEQGAEAEAAATSKALQDLLDRRRSRDKPDGRIGPEWQAGAAAKLEAEEPEPQEPEPAEPKVEEPAAEKQDGEEPEP
jgi:hypothetical protein